VVDSEVEDLEMPVTSTDDNQQRMETQQMMEKRQCKITKIVTKDMLHDTGVQTKLTTIIIKLGDLRIMFVAMVSTHCWGLSTLICTCRRVVEKR